MNQSDNSTLLLNLLEKAEQILSIIYLSDNAIRKYNQLKQLTFNKLGYEFTPLIRRQSPIPYNNKCPTTNISKSFSQRLLNQSIKKTLLIELIFDFLSKIDSCEAQLDNQVFLNRLDGIFHLNQSNTIDEIDYEAQAQEKKLKELFCQTDALFYSHHHNCRELITNYESQINDMKHYYENGQIVLNEKISQLEQDLFQLRKENEMNAFITDQMNQMTSNAYEKYFPKNSSWYGQEKFASEYPELDKVNFLICLLNKFYTDNKYLSDLVPNLQKEKLVLKEETNLPFVKNIIEKNSTMREIVDDIENVERENEKLHKNFEELMTYINKNIEEKLI